MNTTTPAIPFVTHANTTSTSQTAQPTKRPCESPEHALPKPLAAHARNVYTSLDKLAKSDGNCKRAIDRRFTGDYQQGTALCRACKAVCKQNVPAEKKEKREEEEERKKRAKEVLNDYDEGMSAFSFGGFVTN